MVREQDPAATRPVQRKAVVDEMDAPKADSIREERATIDPNRGHAAPAAHGIVGPKTVKALHATGRHQDARPASGAPGASGGEPAAGADGQAHASLLQMKQAAEPAPDADVPAVAAAGVAGTGQPLPHLEPIQASFGRHDVSGVVAHVGGAAGEAAQQIGAVAYATGNHVAFDGAPDLHTTAHEAAHVVRQRGGGTADLQGKGGVGQVGDAHEQHADQVADTVARGESAEALLDAYAAPASSPHGHRALQRKVHSPTRHERGAARLALQQAAALARAHAAEPTATVCFQVADALRYAAASIAPIEGPSEPATLRRFLQPANLAYARAAALHDAASATLGDDDAAVAALHDAMLDLAGRLEPTGWRRPADARAARRRGRRARSRGAKETFGARDRASLVRQSLAAAGDALGIIPSDGHPIAKPAVDAIAARAHQHIEFAFDQMLGSDRDPAPLRHAIAESTNAVPRLDHQALVLCHRTPDILDTVHLANRLRDMVGLPALAPAELNDDELQNALDAAAAFVTEAETYLDGMLSRTALAYSDAWQRHTAALGAQKQHFLRNEMLKEAVISAITGGLSGIAGHIMKVKIGLNDRSAFHAAVIDGIKTLTKTLAKKGLDVAVNTDGLGIFPADPFAFKQEAAVAAKQEMRAVRHTLTAYRVAIADGTFTDRTINPRQLYADMMTVDGTPVLQVALPDRAADSRRFELGFWKAWLTHYAYTVSALPVLPGATSDDDYDRQILTDVSVEQNWGDEIVKAINALGEDGAAWVKQYGGISRRAAEAEKKELKKGVKEA